jgi:hypothetical protein
MVIIIGALMILVLALVGINLSRGSGTREAGPMPPTQSIIHRPQPLLSQADTRIIEREELRRHFLLKGPRLAR